MEKLKEFFTSIKPVLVPTVVMIVICLVVTGALSGTNLLTRDKITEIETKQQNDSMKEVLSAEKYEENTVAVKTDGKKETYTYYTAKSGKKELGNIFVVTEKGYGGDVKVMVAVKPNGKIKAVKVLDVSNETPGLGQNTGNKEWYSQYNGLTQEKEISVVKGSASKGENTVNAVTGATISSKAVTRAVNTALTVNKTLGKTAVLNESEGK